MVMMMTIFWTRATERQPPRPGTRRFRSTSPGPSSRPVVYRWLGSATIAVALLCATAGVDRALAQSDAEAGAQQLFNQARKLMKQKKYEQACDKFEASENLDPAPGTTVNLAVCYEKIGRLATAWSRFRKAADLDKRAGNRKRAKFSLKQAAKLEKRLPSLIINVADKDLPEFEVMRNGEVVDDNLYGVSVYVDPGDHSIIARADGYKQYSQDFTAEEGKGVEIDIPELEPLPVEKKKKKKPDPVDTDETGLNLTGGDGRTDKGGGGSGRRTTGLIMTAVGVAALGAGVGVGFTAKSKWDSAFDDGLCNPDTLVCNAEGQTRTDTARQRALISNIAAGVGGAVAITGVIIWLTAPSKRSASAVSVQPVIQTEQLGMAISGRF